MKIEGKGGDSRPCEGMILETGIQGLLIRFTRVVKDHRGLLCELTPPGSKPPFLRGGLEFVYASIATKKGVMRGGHYHNRATEDFFTLSGSALWFFRDFRRDSPTCHSIYRVVAGSEDPPETGPFREKGIPVYNLMAGPLAQFHVPPGVYHAFIPLSSRGVVVIAASSHPYDPTDYVRPVIGDEEYFR